MGVDPQETTQRHASPDGDLRVQILRPVVAAVMGLAVAAVGLALWSLQGVIRSESHEGEALEAETELVLEQAEERLAMAVQDLARDPSLVGPFLARDRTALLAAVQDRFVDLRDQFGLNHLYFHTKTVHDMSEFHTDETAPQNDDALWQLFEHERTV